MEERRTGRRKASCQGSEEVTKGLWAYLMKESLCMIKPTTIRTKFFFSFP